MKMHSYEDEVFKDERVNDAVNTNNAFYKRGKKVKGLKPSSGNADADEASKSNNEYE